MLAGMGGSSIDVFRMVIMISIQSIISIIHLLMEFWNLSKQTLVLVACR